MTVIPMRFHFNSAKSIDFVPKSTEPPKAPGADETAEMADRGEDVSRFFTRKGSMMPPILPIQRVNIDFVLPMLEELDRQAAELNISRQAVIKTLLRQALDQHYFASQGSRCTGSS